MHRRFPLLPTLVVGLLLAGTASAVPLTGDPSPANPFGWMPNSTNALNFDMLTPGREGQTAPYVVFDSNDVGEVTLEFFNFASGLAFFEIRIDGITTGTTPHFVVTGAGGTDVIHSGGIGVASMSSTLETFTATQSVEVRLALGGERDWDFDWTSFAVASNVPAPGTLLLVAGALIGMAGGARRSRRTG